MWAVVSFLVASILALFFGAVLFVLLAPFVAAVMEYAQDKWKRS